LGNGLLAALGGRENVRGVESVTGRLLLTVGDSRSVDEAAVRALGARGVAFVSNTSVHLLHPDPHALETELAQHLR
jgi:phosphotransferase system IIB component